MEFTFYLCSLVAVLSTLCVIINTNPVHALLHLIVSLLAISGVFFSLGAYFAGALEIIIYAGAIMVLFVFVVMMLNFGKSVKNQKRQLPQPSLLMGFSLVSMMILLMMIVYAIITSNIQGINGLVIDAKVVGIKLFGPYILIVELASMLMLVGLVVAFHIGHGDLYSEMVNNRVSDKVLEKDKEKRT